MMLRSNRALHIKKWLNSKNGIVSSLQEKNIAIENKKMILKLDIEGSEYDLLDEIALNFDIFNCMIFEFHDLDSKNADLYKFLKKCKDSFDMIYLGINPSGGFSECGQPKVIEITLEKKSVTKL